MSISIAATRVAEPTAHETYALVPACGRGHSQPHEIPQVLRAEKSRGRTATRVPAQASTFSAASARTTPMGDPSRSVDNIAKGKTTTNPIAAATIRTSDRRAGHEGGDFPGPTPANAVPSVNANPAVAASPNQSNASNLGGCSIRRLPRPLSPTMTTMSGLEAREPDGPNTAAKIVITIMMMETPAAAKP